MLLGESCLNQAQIRACLLQRHAGLQTAEAAVPQVISIEDEVVIDPRNPEVDVAVGEPERGRHDADDRERLIPEADLSVEHVRIGPEVHLPVAMADQRDGRGAFLVLGGGKAASECRSNAPDIEKTRRDAGQSEPFRQLAGSLGDVFRVVAGDRVESGIELIPFFEAHRSDVADRHALPRFSELHEAVGVGKGQRLHEDGIDSGEYGAVRTDAERERQHDGDREAGRPGEHADRVANIAYQDFEPAHPHRTRPRVTGLRKSLGGGVS